MTLKNALKKQKAQKENVTNKEKINKITFSRESVEKQRGLQTVSLQLSEIIEYEDNARTEFIDEETYALVDSMGMQGFKKDKIKVYHILSPEQYIISDGHRRKKAAGILYNMTDSEFEEKYGVTKIERFGEDFALRGMITVIIEEEKSTFDKQTDLDLMGEVLISDIHKAPLSYGDKLIHIHKFLKKMDDMYPENKPHKVSYKSVRTKYGIPERTANDWQKILDHYPISAIEKMKGSNISGSMMKELIKVTDEVIRDRAVELIESGDIKNTKDISEFNEKSEILESALSEEVENKSQTVAEAASQQYKEDKKMSSQMKGVEKKLKEFKSSINKISKIMGDIEKMGVTQEEENMYQDYKNQLLELLKPELLEDE